MPVSRPYCTSVTTLGLRVSRSPLAPMVPSLAPDPSNRSNAARHCLTLSGLIALVPRSRVPARLTPRHAHRAPAHRPLPTQALRYTPAVFLLLRRLAPAPLLRALTQAALLPTQARRVLAPAARRRHPSPAPAHLARIPAALHLLPAPAPRRPTPALRAHTPAALLHLPHPAPARPPRTPAPRVLILAARHHRPLPARAPRRQRIRARARLLIPAARYLHLRRTRALPRAHTPAAP
ncbi:hypothetical protein B0H13DRAFT_65792 [Mycena leptocephala]|nr:hypothetical protein B0H13DRAFT_65792 [Mycena leptocephala]